MGITVPLHAATARWEHANLRLEFVLQDVRPAFSNLSAIKVRTVNIKVLHKIGRTHTRSKHGELLVMSNNSIALCCKPHEITSKTNTDLHIFV